MEPPWQDVRYGLRMLAKKPGFTAVAVLTLALGIGAITAIFTVVNSVVLRPLPYPRPDRLFLIQSGAPGEDSGPLASDEYVAYKRETRVFEHLAAFSASLGNKLSGAGEPIVIRRCEVSASFWPTLGLDPELGRTFPSEQREGATNLAVISDRLWRNHFGADPRLIGRTVFLDDAPYVIMGVMPPGFSFPWDTDVWSQANLTQISVMKIARYGVIGRLKGSASLHQAQAEMDVFAAQFNAAHPERYPKGEILRPLALHKYVVGDVEGSLLLLLGAVGFVLLIGCANVANLLLARGLTRQQEIAVRASLGASRLRLVQQLLTESLVFSFFGGVSGLLLANWGVRIFLLLIPARDLPRVREIHVDSSVLAFTAAVTLVTGVLFGILPAIHLSDARLSESLKRAGSRWVSSTGQRLKNALVIVEIALALVLLIGAGLLLKSFVRLRSVDPGFKPGDLFTMTLLLPQNRTLKQLKCLERTTLERLASLPGASSIASVDWLPFGHALVESGFTAEGQTSSPGEHQIALRVAVSPGYFRTLGVRLLRGRDFTAADDETAPGVVVIDETFARRIWPGRDPIGKRISFSDRPTSRDWKTVVGVAEDIKQHWLGESPRLEVYQPYLEVDSALWLSHMVFVVRSGANPGLTETIMRQRLHEVDKDQPIYAVETMNSLIRGSIAQPRYESTLLAAFAAIALLIAAVGIYAIVTFSVNERTHEIGIRTALGARRSDILQLVLRNTLLLMTVGVGFGLGGAVALTRVLRSYVFNIKVTDPMTYAAVSFLLVVVGFSATLVPAYRATKVDAMVALRYE